VKGEPHVGQPTRVRMKKKLPRLRRIGRVSGHPLMGGTPIRVFGVPPVAILAGHRTVDRIVFEKGLIYEDLLVRSQRLHRIAPSPLPLGLQRDLGSRAPLLLQLPYRADQLARSGVAGDAVILPGIRSAGRAQAR